MAETVPSDERKMKESACKIKAREIYPSTACVFFNMCSRKKVSFGLGIMALIPQQDQKIKTC